MTLDVIIATYKPEGIERTARMYLPEIKDVGYVISWQAHENYPIPNNLIRDDIRIFRYEESGLSKNRNNAIAHSDADINYLADDDIIIMPGALEKIIKRFREYPDTQVATFKMKETRKTYPKEITELGFYLPKNYYVATYQIAFLRNLYPDLRFNEFFGPGSNVFECGEDELFHLCARKKGLKCRFFPDVIASHPHESTGIKKVTDSKIVEGFGAIITKSYPVSFLFRIPLKAYRLYGSKQYGFLSSLYHLMKGCVKSASIKI